MNRDEEFQARKRATEEVRARLESRGIEVRGDEQPEALADLLSAVERFELTVEAHGGDLMVDDLKSTRPDDAHFVVPRRARGEAVHSYIVRIDEAAARLGHHPRHTD